MLNYHHYQIKFLYETISIQNFIFLVLVGWKDDEAGGRNLMNLWLFFFVKGALICNCGVD